MRDLAGLELERKDEDLTHGWLLIYVLRRLGHLPRVGEQVRIDGYIVYRSGHLYFGQRSGPQNHALYPLLRS
jgi:hypothetical protein